MGTRIATRRRVALKTDTSPPLDTQALERYNDYHIVPMGPTYQMVQGCEQVVLIVGGKCSGCMSRRLVP